MSSSAALRPISGLAPAPRPLVSAPPSGDLQRRLVRLERLDVGVGDDEVDAFEARLDHRVDRVAAATADADHLDLGAIGRLVIKLQKRHR